MHPTSYYPRVPAQILMDEKGRTKISDLGLAVTVPKQGISGACGTRGYWAPEMLKRNEETNAKSKYFVTVDWFSLGVVCYEFVSGVCPFRCDGGGDDDDDDDNAEQ